LDDVESADGKEVDHVGVAGRAFLAAHLHLQTPGETGRTIGKTRGALRGMWMDMVPNSMRGIQKKKVAKTMPGKGFGGGLGPISEQSGGPVKDKVQDNADGDSPGGQGPRFAREGRGGAGECYQHCPFLGNMLPGQTLRMKRGMGGVAALASVMPLEDEEDDADLADDVYAFIRRTPLPWTHARIMQVALAEFRGVD